MTMSEYPVWRDRPDVDGTVSRRACGLCDAVMIEFDVLGVSVFECPECGMDYY